MEGSVAFAMQAFQYKEFDDDGSLLDREDGTLPGVVFGLGMARERWNFVGELAVYSGDVDYDGQTNTRIPITTQTDANITDGHVRAEWWGWEAGSVRYAVYGGLGYHGWERDIQATRTASGAPVSGLWEYYEWGYVLLGGKLAAEQGLNRWGLDLRLLRTVAPTVRVDFNGLFDDKTLDLGERFGGRLSATWARRASNRTVLKLEPFYEGWDLGRSDTERLTQGGVAVGTVFEPRSETRNFGVNLGLAHTF
jgi:hypothetical protein